MSKNAENHRQLVASVGDAAKMLGLSRPTIYRLIALGRLKTVKIGARRLVPLGAIDALLNEGAVQ
jgi:excisionase family DNA binding protein